MSFPLILLCLTGFVFILIWLIIFIFCIKNVSYFVNKNKLIMLCYWQNILILFVLRLDKIGVSIILVICLLRYSHETPALTNLQYIISNTSSSLLIFSPMLDSHNRIYYFTLSALLLGLWYVALAFLSKSFHENKWPIKTPQFSSGGVVSLCVTRLNNHSDICLVLCLLACWLIGSRLNNPMLARLRHGPVLIVFRTSVLDFFLYPFTNRWAATGPSNLCENNCHKVNFIAGFMHLWAGRRCPVPGYWWMGLLHWLEWE